VVDGDGVELFRNATGLLDLARHQLAEVLQMHMAGHELGERIHHGNDRFTKILVLHAGRAPEAAGARHVAAMGGGAGTIGRHRKSLGCFEILSVGVLMPGPGHGLKGTGAWQSRAGPLSRPSLIRTPSSRETAGTQEPRKIQGRPNWPD